MRGPFLRLIAATFWLAASAVWAATPAIPTDPLINAFLVSINRDPPDGAATAEERALAVCRRTMSDNLDFNAFLAQARIRAMAAMTDDQQKAFRTAAEHWLVGKCVERSHGREALEFVGLRSGENGDRLLATRSSKTLHTIVWRLRGSEILTAADLIVDGSSTAQRLRDEAASLLRTSRDNVDAMIALLGREGR